MHSPFAIGTPLQGGFYAGLFLFDGAPHALVVAPKALGEIAPAAWLDKYELVPRADSCVDGLANTLAMAEAGSTLAKSALALQIDGFTDWYLPSRDELELLYRHFKPTTQRNWAGFRDGDNPSSLPAGHPYTDEAPVQTSVQAFQAGGAEAFEPQWYWASTQSSRGYAWGQSFDDGYQLDNDKEFEARARAVRRFRA